MDVKDNEFKNIVFQLIAMKNTHVGPHIKVETKKGGFLKDSEFRDIDVCGAQLNVIQVNTDYHKGTLSAQSSNFDLEDITFDSITSYSTIAKDHAVSFDCSKEIPCQKI